MVFYIYSVYSINRLLEWSEITFLCEIGSCNRQRCRDVVNKHGFSEEFVDSLKTETWWILKVVPAKKNHRESPFKKTIWLMIFLRGNTLMNTRQLSNPD